jgi:hypothetical protein
MVARITPHNILIVHIHRKEIHLLTRKNANHMAIELEILRVDAHDGHPGEDKIWLPGQQHKLHHHCPPRGELVRPCLEPNSTRLLAAHAHAHFLDLN